MISHPGPPAEDDRARHAREDVARARRGRGAGGSRDRAADAMAVMFGVSPGRALISREWVHLAMPMLLGLVAIGVTNRSLPPLLSLPFAVSGCGLVSLSGWLRRCERAPERTTAQRSGLLLLAVAAPLAAYGMAVGAWAAAGLASWPSCLATLVLISLLAAVFENGRLAGVLAAQIAMWSGVTCVTSRVGGFFALGIGVTITWIAYRRQKSLEAARRVIEAEQARAQTRAEDILADYEQTGQGWFWETDRRGAITYISEPVARVLGFAATDLIGRPLTKLFNLGAQAGEGERTLAFHLSARSAFSDLAVRAATANEERWWSINGRPTYDEFNNFQGFRGSGTDLTEKRRSQEHASRLAQFDSLTGLSNRLRMAQSLEKILTAPHLGHRVCSVFLLDLDRFKQVNDTLGHPAGDALLKQVAQRLERVVGNLGRVGRLGGDEFEVILPGKIESEKLGHLAARVIETLSQPYSIEGSRVMIGASIGVARAPDDGVTSEALIRNADLALYAAKDGGRGRYHFYAADLHSDAEERRRMEEELRDALTHGQLELYYQPVVQTSTERITGFEALLRWHHPEKGWISPAKFIPIAEDTGLIAQIGEWALRTACREMAEWPENVRVAVNVSPLQFANPALPSVVTGALAHAGIAPARLELEITESVFLNEGENTDAMFKALKGIGVRLALDDFGTGYSSLGYLKKAPFDKIKIDQGFVRGATQPGSRNGAIIASIVSLAEALHMETTAEGVETLDELDLVRLLGCSHVQGYIYEKPLSAADAALRVRNGLTAVAHGPRSARATRQSMLRRVSLEHGGHIYPAMIRNISQTGALIEGLWNVPPDTIFQLTFAAGDTITVTTRWSKDDRLGIEFAQPLKLDEHGRIAVVSARAPLPAAMPAPGLRQAG